MNARTERNLTDDPVRLLKAGAPQTAELKLAAVRQDGEVLLFIPKEDRTPSLCLSAVQSRGTALQFVPEELRTDTLCLAAVLTSGVALKWVPIEKQTPGLCMAALQQSVRALEYVKDQTPELCRLALQRQGSALKYIREENQTRELCELSLEQASYAGIELKYPLLMVKNEVLRASLAAARGVAFPATAPRRPDRFPKPVPAIEPKGKRQKQVFAGENSGGHDYTNDLTAAFCAAVYSNADAHELVRAWCDKQGDGAVLTPAAAKEVFRPSVLAKMKIFLKDLPAGEINWQDLSDEFHADGAGSEGSTVKPSDGSDLGITGAKANEAPTREIDADVMAVLRNCTASDQAVFLPPVQLNPKLYKKVNEVLTVLGGKWTRSIAGHKFADDPREVLGAVQASGAYLNPKDFGFFATPPGLAARVAALLKLEPGERGFEPEAGGAALADAAAAYVGVENIDTAELLDMNVEKLQAKGYKVVGRDFLAMEPTAIYDFVIMNPPFGAQADMKHVQHAARFLKPTGRLAAIMSPSFQFRSSKVAESFRELMAAAGDHEEEIAAGTFREAGTDVRTVLVMMDAARMPWNQALIDAEEASTSRSCRQRATG